MIPFTLDGCSSKMLFQFNRLNFKEKQRKIDEVELSVTIVPQNCRVENVSELDDLALDAHWAACLWEKAKIWCGGWVELFMLQKAPYLYLGV